MSSLRLFSSKFMTQLVYFEPFIIIFVMSLKENRWFKCPSDHIDAN